MIIVGLGSNLGNREENLRTALRLLTADKKVQIEKVSSLYETEPVGVTDQNAFLNAVAVVKTGLTPEELIQHCLAVEARMGRVRELRWGPRNIDIDLLCYDAVSIQTETLTIPHPRMKERKFVLIPLLETVGDIVLYGSSRISDFLAACPDASEAVVLYKQSGWEGIELHGS